MNLEFDSSININAVCGTLLSGTTVCGLNFIESGTCLSNKYLCKTAGLTGATNGLHTTGQDIKLGGTLSECTHLEGAQCFDIDAVRGFNLRTSGNTDINIDSQQCGGFLLKSQCGSIDTFPDFTAAVGFYGNIEQPSGFSVIDNRTGTGQTGIVYAGDYSSNYVPRSLVDKAYVDSVATGLNIHESVLVATTVPITLSGTSQTIDGVPVTTVISVNNRILVKNQTLGQFNGIYSASTGTWGRTSDYQTNVQITNGDLIPVTSGSTQNSSIWALTTPEPITVGTTPLIYTEFSTVVDVQAGNGINVVQTGGVHTISVQFATNCGLTFCGTGLAINPWLGTTANGVGTYVNGTCICSNPNMTFDGTQLKVTGNLCATTCVRSPIITGGTLCASTCVIASNAKLTAVAAKTSEACIAYFKSDGTIVSGTTSSGFNWAGTTANGVGTYVSATCVCSNPNMTFDGSSLAVTGNVKASTYVCSPTITGSTKVCSPIIFGTTCISSPISCGTTCAISPITIGSTCVCAPVILASTSICSPAITGSTCVVGARVCATTCFIGSGAGLTGIAASLTVGNSGCLGGTPSTCFAKLLTPTFCNSITVCGASPLVNIQTCCAGTIATPFHRKVSWLKYSGAEVGSIDVLDRSSDSLDTPMVFSTMHSDGNVCQDMTIINGKLGLGTTTPNFRFEVNGPDAYMHFVNAGTGCGSGDGTIIGLDSTSDLIFYIRQRENANMLFYTNDTPRMCITDTGIVCSSVCFAGSGAGLTSVPYAFRTQNDPTCPTTTLAPGGANRPTANTTETGAIKIKLPTAMHNSNTMFNFTIKIYQYSTGQSHEIMVGGYNYSAGGWYNVFATNLTDTGPDIHVRFGDDGTSDVVWLGELGTVWQYPQITVIDFNGGYSQYNNGWSTGWAISIATSFDTVETDYGNAARMWTNKNFSAPVATNTASTPVCRDGSGNFAMGTLTAGDVLAGSDIRIKTCIQPIKDALSTVIKLQGVCYELCDDDQHTNQIGLIAQHTQTILPAIVAHIPSNENDYKYGICDDKLGINYEKITAVLIEAIKELDKKYNCLRNDFNYYMNLNYKHE